MTLRALALNCTLKAGTERFSTDRLLEEVLEALREFDVDGEILRVANHNVEPGIKSDEAGATLGLPFSENPCERYPYSRTPIWMGEPSSIAKRVVERLDAQFDDKDDQGRMKTYNKVAAVAVVGNEDGAHHVSAEIFQALNDVGFSIASNAVTYWVGEAMGDKNYIDLKRIPRNVSDATRMLATNTSHLAHMLKAQGYLGKKT